MANEIVKHNGGKIAKSDDFAYITEQMELMKSMRLPPTMVETHMVRIDPDGYKVLVKRKNPISIYDFDPDGHTASIVASQKLYTDKMFGIKKKGKYNDEERIVNVLSVEVGETTEMVSGF